jgi:hypothetical protein
MRRLAGSPTTAGQSTRIVRPKLATRSSVSIDRYFIQKGSCLPEFGMGKRTQFHNPRRAPRVQRAVSQHVREFVSFMVDQTAGLPEEARENMHE